MGIGYMALWGFGAKCLIGWMDEADTPYTVMTTRTPEVLQTLIIITFAKKLLLTRSFGGYSYLFGTCMCTSDFATLI